MVPTTPLLDSMLRWDKVRLIASQEPTSTTTGLCTSGTVLNNVIFLKTLIEAPSQPLKLKDTDMLHQAIAATVSQKDIHRDVRHAIVRRFEPALLLPRHTVIITGHAYPQQRQSRDTPLDYFCCVYPPASSKRRKNIFESKTH